VVGFVLLVVCVTVVLVQFNRAQDTNETTTQAAAATTQPHQPTGNETTASTTTPSTTTMGAEVNHLQIRFHLVL